jgi:ectoine hydroxylase-related dioxygenase (phytanoyl-CoA dioxygenase family)
MKFPLIITHPPQGASFAWSGEYTDEMRKFLSVHGFIRFRGFARMEEIEALRGELARIEKEWISAGRTEVNGIPIKFGTNDEGEKFVNRFAFTSLFSPWLHNWLTDPRWELVRTICGPDFRIGESEKDGVVVNHFMNVPGSNYTKLGWHVDSLRDIFYGKLPQPMWNVGLYIDDSHANKGALRVIPGTHVQGLMGMLFGKRHFMDNEYDSREYIVEADAGDLTLHDGRIWHRVGHATVSGVASRRRTMYIPFLNGEVEEKNESSKTPFYHRFSGKIR